MRTHVEFPLLQEAKEKEACSADESPSVAPSAQNIKSSHLPCPDQVIPAKTSISSSPLLPKDVENLRQMGDFGDVILFMYNELRLVTKDFRPDLVIGEGGFGFVYKGVIDDSIRPGFQYTEVAVKELNPEGQQGHKEWLAELKYLGQLSHPNLVKLIGYCCEGDHRLLVYEYMAQGSLEKHLFLWASTTLTWSIRLKIALDAAKGLAFLHEAKRPIIYRDLKASNILLDAEFNGKLSDFGLAKEGPTGDQTHVSTRVMGTLGYAAPEYLMTGHLTFRSDVYAFGVVLLEMLIGERAIDSNRPSQVQNLVDWARPLLVRINKLLLIFDPRMKGQYSPASAEAVANLAFNCLSHNPKGRPTMREVVNMLEKERERSLLPPTDTEVEPDETSKQTAEDPPGKSPQSENNAKPQRQEFKTNLQKISESRRELHKQFKEPA